VPLQSSKPPSTGSEAGVERHYSVAWNIEDNGDDNAALLLYGKRSWYRRVKERCRGGCGRGDRVVTKTK
jgi:hypothetical protein